MKTWIVSAEQHRLLPEADVLDGDSPSEFFLSRLQRDSTSVDLLLLGTSTHLKPSRFCRSLVIYRLSNLSLLRSMSDVNIGCHSL